MSGVTKENLVDILEKIYATIEENKSYLSKLDTEIGDGDHGFSISNGFKNVHDKLGEFSAGGIGDLLKKSGFEIIKVVGGASGAVFGTLFTGQASFYTKKLDGKDSLSLEELTGMLTEALQQIKQRGGAQPGDKTMIDALEPAIEELKNGVKEGLRFGEAFTKAAQRAKAGAESTKNMVAKRGRSKNVGERSIGYMDPGAMSTALIFTAIAEYFTEKKL
jgi:dihydroxyacetone kinase-like protein